MLQRQSKPLFIYFFILNFWPCSWHAEVLGPAIEPVPQQWQHQVFKLLSHQRTLKPLLKKNKNKKGLSVYPFLLCYHSFFEKLKGHRELFLFAYHLLFNSNTQSL